MKKWSVATEELVDEPMTDDDRQRYRDGSIECTQQLVTDSCLAGLLNMDRYLGAYQFDDSFKKWLSLSEHITPALIARSQLFPSHYHHCHVHFMQIAAQQWQDLVRHVLRSKVCS